MKFLGGSKEYFLKGLERVFGMSAAEVDVDPTGKLDMLANCVLEELIEDVSLGLCYETHRAAKLGYLMLEESAIEEEKKYRIVDKKGLDVFGESSNSKKNSYECQCPNCERTLAASRFAPHLEKCMGMGRKCSRLASKRITASTGSKPSTMTAAIGAESDIEDNDKSSDNDWNEKSIPVKRSKKKKITEKLTNGVVKRLTKSRSVNQNSSLSQSNGPSSTVTSINGLRSSDSNLIEARLEKTNSKKT